MTVSCEGSGVVPRLLDGLEGWAGAAKLFGTATVAAAVEAASVFARTAGPEIYTALCSSSSWLAAVSHDKLMESP